MSEHDKAIIEAAEAYVGAFTSDVSTTPPHKALIAAVAAKREAMKPKLLDVNGLLKVCADAPAGRWPEAVLDAVYASALRVIEGLPRHDSFEYRNCRTLLDIECALRAGRDTQPSPEKAG